MLQLTRIETRRIKNHLRSDVGRKLQVFELLADETRYRIVQALVLQPELCVTDLTELLGFSMPAISHHLKLLKSGGVVVSTRMGQMLCYRLAPGPEAVFIRRALARSFAP